MVGGTWRPHMLHHASSHPLKVRASPAGQAAATIPPERQVLSDLPWD